MAGEVVGRGAAEASPLEIGEGESLEGEGEWVGVGRDIVGQRVASSFGRGLGVGGWRLVGHR